jgi:hypothetical protein
MFYTAGVKQELHETKQKFEKCLTDDAMQQEILEPYIKART